MIMKKKKTAKDTAMKDLTEKKKQPQYLLTQV